MSAYPAPLDRSRPRERLEFVDRLRGLVMVLMALDHTRDILQRNEVLGQAMDLQETYPALFLTRWVTHLCAPTFILLAGAGIYLGRAAGKSRGELSWFLFSRGLWLAILEVTYVNVAWFMDQSFHDVPAAVLWSIGW